MEEINISFADRTEQVIVSYFASPQDPELHPNIGIVLTSDLRWRAFYESLPEQMSSWLPVPQPVTPLADPPSGDAGE